MASVLLPPHRCPLSRTERTALHENCNTQCDLWQAIRHGAIGGPPRPGTAAARWESDFVRGKTPAQRIQMLQKRAGAYSEAFRSTFVGQTVQLLVERNAGLDQICHGRCERYFDVHFESDECQPGDLVEVRVDRVTPTQTFATMLRILARRAEPCPA